MTPVPFYSALLLRLQQVGVDRGSTMFARPIELLIAVSALLYMDHVSGQCISTPYVSWHSCGVPHYANPQSCDRADIFFHINRETNVSG